MGECTGSETLGVHSVPVCGFPRSLLKHHKWGNLERERERERETERQGEEKGGGLFKALSAADIPPTLSLHRFTSSPPPPPPPPPPRPPPLSLPLLHLKVRASSYLVTLRTTHGGNQKKTLHPHCFTDKYQHGHHRFSFCFLLSLRGKKIQSTKPQHTQ